MINTYGEQKLLPDYWFIVTLSRAEIVSDFFHQISDSFRMYGRVLQNYKTIFLHTLRADFGCWRLKHHLNYYVLFYEFFKVRYKPQELKNKIL